MPSLLEARQVSKSFAGVPVLQDVYFDLLPGEVHAVMGENGAGKSTLMKVLSGEHEPDSGQILCKGHTVRFRSPRDGLRAGIAMIYQEPMPFADLTVAENIFIGQEPTSTFVGWLDKRAMRHEAEGIIRKLGAAIAGDQRMRNLRVADMQIVEIAKALAHQAQVLIMDEPTSALSEHETEALFLLIRELKQRGLTVVYISHKLEEVLGIADRVTVLRDGCKIATEPASTLNREKMITFMVGRELTSVAALPSPLRLNQTRRRDELSPSPGQADFKSHGKAALAVKRLGKKGHFQNVSFHVHRGEVLGIAGLMGAGRTDVLNAIYGLDPADSGEIYVSGFRRRIGSPPDALRAGIGLVSEDRMIFGLVPTMDVKRNLTLAALRDWCRAGFILRAAENAVADERIREFQIKTHSRNQLVSTLSGGNQQKVVLARTLLTRPGILLLDEPTRGIDIAAKAEMHAIISQLARSGKAVVLVSSELPELLALSHRILVMREGALTTELDARRTTPEEIMKHAMPG